MESTTEPGPHPAQVMVALGQQPHDLAVLGGLDSVQTLRAHGSDRHRERVVGVVLLRPSRAEDADSRGQGRWNVDDVLSCIDELLGQQIAEAAGGLDGPRAFSERLSPGEDLAVFWHVARTVTLATSRSSPQIATAVWLCLWGSTPMITVMSASWSVDGNREGTLDSDLVHTPLLSHIAARSRRVALRKKASRTGRRQAQREPSRRDLQTLRINRSVCLKSQSGTSGTRVLSGWRVGYVLETLIRLGQLAIGATRV